MNNKRLKPNLLDPAIEKRIIKTLRPEQEDYWEPTKNTFQSIYSDYIQPNIYFVIFLVLVFLLLLYRYRIIQKNRNENYYEQPIIQPPVVNNNFIDLYNMEKEQLMDMEINKGKKGKKDIFSTPARKVAYPMYPYSDGGTLVPSGKK